jgi:hypothetical protein
MPNRVSKEGHERTAGKDRMKQKRTGRSTVFAKEDAHTQANVGATVRGDLEWLRSKSVSRFL